MSDLRIVLGAVVNLMRFEFTIWGYTLSYWEIMIWAMLAGIVIWIIVEVLS